MAPRNDDITNKTITVRDLITWVVILVGCVGTFFAVQIRVAVLETKQSTTDEVIREIKAANQAEAQQMVEFRREMQESNRKQIELLEKQSKKNE